MAIREALKVEMILFCVLTHSKNLLISFSFYFELLVLRCELEVVGWGQEMEAAAGLVAGVRLEPGLLVLQGPLAKEDIMEGVGQTPGALIPGAGGTELLEQEHRYQIYPG